MCSTPPIREFYNSRLCCLCELITAVYSLSHSLLMKPKNYNELQYQTCTLMQVRYRGSGGLLVFGGFVLGVL